MAFVQTVINEESLFFSVKNINVVLKYLTKAPGPQHFTKKNIKFNLKN